MGSSAGGGLSLSAARKVVLGQSSVPKNAIKGIVAIVPVAFHPATVPEAYKADYVSYKENAENVPMIDKTSMDQFFDITGVTPENKDYFVGIDAEAHKLLPPTYVATCEFDPLRDDGKVLVKILEKAGIPVKHDHYDGLPHCFWYFPKLPETRTFMGNTFAGINWALEQM